MFPFKIITLEGVVYEGSATRVHLKTVEGEITVLPKHAPLLSLARPGELHITDGENNERTFAVSGGFFEVRKNGEVVMLSDIAELPETIDLEAAEQARTRAEEVLAATDSLSAREFARVQGMLEHEIARIAIGGKYQAGRK